MRKILTLALMAMVTVGAQAEEKKTPPTRTSLCSR